MKLSVYYNQNQKTVQNNGNVSDVVSKKQTVHTE